MAKNKKINNATPLIVAPSKDIKKEKPPKFTQSGHFIDQKLHNPHRAQATIFDTLLPNTIEKIDEAGEIETTVEGIKLTEKEEQTINGILQLLHEKSDTNKDTNNKPKNTDTFYKGNYNSNKTIYGGKYTATPAIIFKPIELYKIITGKKNPSQRDINYIKDAIDSLSNKKFLIAYNRTYKQGKESKIDRVEEYQPLIKTANVYKELTPVELQKIEQGDSQLKNQKGEIALVLNPIFRDQIDTKFIEYPLNVNKLTKIAYGGGRVPQCVTILRDYLLRAQSCKKKTIYIDIETLPRILKLERYQKEGRKKLIQERIDKSIDTCIKLGILVEVKETRGVNYQLQYEFTVNLDY